MTMHVHILGIGGTFMGGVAAIAKAAGFRVTGSDLNVYPPMSTQLEALGIEFVQGYGAEQLDLQARHRGGRQCLEPRQRRSSRPCWIAAWPTPPGRNGWPSTCCAHKHVIAVAGTHGKTTTTAMLTWILEDAGLAPGFLIGGVPSNFDATARLGTAPFFVIEADEYDTAFFDKRAKFVHYRPRTAILNNLEYDHADIYPDVAVDPPPVQSAAAHRAGRRPAHRQRRRMPSSRPL